jgi:hypothetical protein
MESYAMIDTIGTCYRCKARMDAHDGTVCDAWICPCGHDLLTLHDDGACRAEGCPCQPLDGSAILAAVAAADPTLAAYVEQTGGGCATVYVGTPDADGHYLAAIGPGSFDWSDANASQFYPNDLYIGPDDCGTAPPWDAGVTLAGITDYLRPCADCGAPTGAHATADACEAAGIDPGLRDGLGCAVWGSHDEIVRMPMR